MPTPKSFDCCLEQDGVIAAIGNAGGEDDGYLPAYPYGAAIGNRKDKTQCWVAATPGKRFCVHWGYEGNPAERLNQGLKCYISIDKVPAAVGYMPPDFVQDSRDMEITGFQRFDNIELPFCFGRREVTDKDTLSTREKSAEMLGTIEVVVFWARIDENSDEPEDEPDMDGHKCIKNEELIMKPVLEEETKVRHEFAASLGDPEASEAMRIKYKTERVDNKDYRFVFHYAPKDWLVVNLSIRPVGKLSQNRPFSREPRLKTERTTNGSGSHNPYLRTSPHELPRKPTRAYLHRDLNAPLLTTSPTILYAPSPTPARTSKRRAEIIDFNTSESLPPSRRVSLHRQSLVARTRMLKRRVDQTMVEEIDVDAWDEKTHDISSYWVKKPQTNGSNKRQK